MRIFVKWYFDGLLGYLIMLIMSFSSIPVIAYDKNKPECIFSCIEMFFYIETTTKRKQNDSIFQSYDFNETVCC